MTLKYAPPLTRPNPLYSEGAPDTEAYSLIQRAKRGDADAFARLYHSYLARVYSYMFFHVNDEIMADDLTARVFLKAWRNIRCYEPGKPPFGVWLYLIARDALLSFAGDRTHQPPVREIIAPSAEGLEVLGDFQRCTDP